MIDLTTLQLVTAIPSQILALEAANKTLLMQNEALTRNNKMLQYIGIALGITSVAFGFFLLMQYLDEKEEEMEKRSVIKKTQTSAEKDDTPFDISAQD